MGNTVKARIVKMGNSKGVRIPKAILEQLGLSDEVELSVRADHLVIRSSRAPREGWEEQFARMAEQRDDRLLDEQTVSTTQWDEDEWEWE